MTNLPYDFMNPPCIRTVLDNIKPDEKHPCYFCGKKIEVGEAVKCLECGHLKCTHCGKCYCDGTELEKRTLVRIHKRYCRNMVAILDFTHIDIRGDENIIKNATRALEYCRNKLQNGGGK